MKIKATNIDLINNQVDYTILTDDLSQEISAGRTVDYTSAINADPGKTMFEDLFAVIAADAVANTDSIKALVTQSKTAATAAITSGQQASSIADSKLASLDTAPQLTT